MRPKLISQPRNYAAVKNLAQNSKVFAMLTVAPSFWNKMGIVLPDGVQF